MQNSLLIVNLHVLIFMIEGCYCTEMNYGGGIYGRIPPPIEPSYVFKLKFYKNYESDLFTYILLNYTLMAWLR
jgi:hypothetical protein